MAYDKKYPNINDEILAFDKGQEDRIENNFNQLNNLIQSVGVVEIGENFAKLNKGFMVCWGNTSLTGNNDGNPKIISLPHAFKNTPVVLQSIGRNASSVGVQVSSVLDHSKTNNKQIAIFHTSSTQLAVLVDWIAIGIY